MLNLLFRRRTSNLPKSAIANINLTSELPCHQLDDRYLSFSIDISVLVGGHWWEGGSGSSRGLGTQKVPPIDLNQPKLDALVQALAPAYLRIGGSEADTIRYFCDQDLSSPDDCELTQIIWDRLLDFINRNQLGFMFTFRYGLFARQEHGQWNPFAATKLLAYTLARGSHIDVAELGNELNAYWAFHGLSAQPRATTLAADYSRFIRSVKKLSPETRVAGPGSAFWPRLGETIRPLSNITDSFLEQLEEPLDIVDWHYYPFQSSRSPIRTRAARLENLLAPTSLQEFSKHAERLRQWQQHHQPQAQLWTGETGSAQCGGQPKLSDRFASCFWWADQLGRGALHGQKVMIRQSLIGGDYGLINRRTMKPNPDFWVSWLWKKLIGPDVYQVQSSHPDLLVYCHGGHKPNKRTLLIINLSGKSYRVKCPQLGREGKRFEITAAKLNAKKILINGKQPKFRMGRVSLKDFPKLAKLDLVAPYSINFWTYSTANTGSSTLVPAAAR
ncbi:glycosyl hydrolase family 79 N-terminal domain-containing protein [Maribrevibacterium harenarium]|uniref:glycoside hydrolase n=1 Tax=Maribrevibacterium harenarium TaxID=2589817 RepID=UPI001F478975|nr:glycoside hydrolase [Maribrevibacterium harenarium]